MYRPRSEEIGIIVSKDGIGDTIMSLPLFRRALTAIGSKGRLILILKSAAEEDIVRLASADDPRLDIRLIGARRDWKTTLSAVWLALTLRLEKPDWLIAFASQHGAGMPIFSALVGARKACGPLGRWSRLGYSATVDFRDSEHKGDYFQRFADAVGIPKFDCNGPLLLPKGLREKARALLPEWAPDQTWVALAPGSGQAESHKRWPAERFNELLERIQHSRPGIRVLIVGGPGEDPLLQEVTRGNPNIMNVRLAVQSPRLAIALLSWCHCVVAACSGFSHMAAAAGIPVIGLYGPTNPGFTGPREGMYVVRLGLSCSPCYRDDFIYGCGQPVCMSQIGADEVLATTLAVLDGKEPPAPGFFKPTSATMPGQTSCAA